VIWNLESGIGVFAIEPPGEASKTLRTVEAIVGQMERERYGRDTALIALGGGVVGDVAGFAAAIFKRGVPCVQVPTTTVALADSAIGGKVGVDSELSKNAYGVFSHPARVYMDCDTVRTLDERHYRAGLVESIKHAMIADAAYFDYLEAHLDQLLARDGETLVHITRLNVAIKGDVVFRDPEEANLRRVLNYGHTIGHAVESASGYALHHGEAVAIGIVGACLIAERLGLAASEARERAVALFRRLGLPLRLPPSLSEGQLLDSMTRDKKARGGAPRFVLLEAIGRVHCPTGQYAVEVPAGLLRAALEGLR
jgi:3-dehydroquinate synthase